MKSHICVSAITGPRTPRQLQFRGTCVEDWLSKSLDNACPIETRLNVVKLKQFTEVALGEAWNFLIVLRPFLETRQSLASLWSKSSIIFYTIINSFSFVLEQSQTFNLSFVLSKHFFTTF